MIAEDTLGAESWWDKKFSLISRFSVVLVILLVTGICTLSVAYTYSVTHQLEQNHQALKARQLRNGYVAISDIQRLLIAAQLARAAGEMTDDLAQEFREATDFLYVRTDHFRSVVALTDMEAVAAPAITALEGIVAVADAATRSDYQHLDQTVIDLLEEAEAARVALVHFLDRNRRDSDSILDLQIYAIQRQQLVAVISLLAVGLISWIGLILLRKEVAGRRARKKAEDRLNFLAFYDPLTALPNRVQFQEKLQQALDETAAPVALFSFDVDEFKSTNDTYGHAGGDAVLRHVGRVLEAAAVEHDGLAARMSGDEFALMVPQDDHAVLGLICSEIIEAAAEPFDFNGNSLNASLSIGVATNTQIRNSIAASVSSLSHATDFALYASKTNGRRGYTIYDQTLDAKFLERRELLEALPRALQRDDELLVFLQPKVKLPSTEVYGFEALVRWKRGEDLLGPGHFVGLAEDSGLIADLDCYVLGHATKLIADWNAQHGTAFSISVNLSAVHFASDRIVQRVEHALWRSELPPELLTLEITESIEMRDWRTARHTIRRLNDLGCLIAIDDFGTGYSSLAYLRSVNAHELKVDRALLHQVEESERARTLLNSVMEIGRRLDLEVIVEGVETQSQARVLNDIGCTRAQGFLFGRPEVGHKALEMANATSPDQRSTA